ncbi:MAG TPA: hypothetical protein DEO71_11955 [Chryseobacterium sp.]|nr:hypothetical protein [Chryseobacterium sp.]
MELLPIVKAALEADLVLEVLQQATPIHARITMNLLRQVAVPAFLLAQRVFNNRKIKEIQETV